jgi:peptidoglycan/LPS O-acetylase OafA/YrhL
MAAAPRADIETAQGLKDARLAGHVPVLVGVRGIAILAVIIFHAVVFDARNRFELALAMAAAFGWAGVDLFFVLSGFLITGILLKAREGPGYYRTFYVRRGLRIFPLYFGYCVVLFVVLPMIYGWSSPEAGVLKAAAPWYVTYMLNVRMAMFGAGAAVMSTSFLWSLAVEEQFYLLWPAIVRRVRLAHLSRLCLAIAVVALCWRIWMVRSGHVLAAYVLLPSRMDGLALGAWVAIQVTRPGMLDRLARAATPVLAACIVALLAIIAKSGQAGWEMPVMSTIGLTFTALASTAFIVLVVAGGGERQTLLSRAVASAPLRFFGRYAYGLYVLADAGTRLVKFAGLPGLVPKLVLGSPLPWQLWNLSLILASTTLLALISWRFIEQPALSLKRLFPYGETRRVGSPYVVPAPNDGARRVELEQV